MPFHSPRQVYDNHHVRKARQGEATLAPLPVTNAERERRVAQTFEDAVKATLATPHLQFKHLVRLLEDPRFGPSEIIDKFPWDVFETTFRDAEQALVDQLVDGANQDTARLFTDAFTSRDPEVLIWGATHAAEMVTHISREQRRLLRNHVMNSHLSGIPPMDLAREIRGIVGLTPKWQGAVVRYHRGLLAKGTSPELASKQTAKYHARLRTARAKMIARTEVMRAENEGKVMGWKRAISLGLLSVGGVKKWHTAITNVCPVCLPMDGQTTDLDSTFRVSDAGGRSWDVRTPPSHPHCRCTLTYEPPSIEQMTGGYSIEDLMAEITSTPYTPDSDADSTEDPWATTTLTLAPDPSPDLPSRIPSPPTFTRRGEAQTWLETHLPDTTFTYTHHTIDPTTRRSVPTTRALPRFYDFEDLSLDAVQHLTEAAVDFANDYPEAWGTVTRYGSLHAIYRGQHDLPDTVGGGVYAQTSSDDVSHHRTLGLNKTWFDSETSTKYADAYAKDVASNFHPPTIASPTRTVIDHEFGHVLIYHLATSHGDKAISTLLDLLYAHTGYPPSFWNLSTFQCQNYVADQIGRYAVESWHEFIAEAWAAHLYAPTPNPISTAVAEWVRDLAS